MEFLDGLADYGALGIMLAVTLSVAGYLIRDLIRQRDAERERVDAFTDALDRLTDSHEATHELVRTTNRLLESIQQRGAG